jgi:hypothetical protein
MRLAYDSVNSVDKTGFIPPSSPMRIVLNGKPKKLALADGNNTVQVVSLTGQSNVFSFTR